MGQWVLEMLWGELFAAAVGLVVDEVNLRHQKWKVESTAAEQKEFKFLC